VGGTDRIDLHGATDSWEKYPDAALAPLSNPYRRREPEKTLLYEVVRDNLPAFLTDAQGQSPDGQGVPWFVQKEFEKYLDCGVIDRGFCRVLCSSCGTEIVVGLSCKQRGFCPSCTTRRMLDVSFHLVDRVLPFVPYRQWVLTYPGSSRLRLAYDREFFVAARRIALAAIFAWQRREARKVGIADPRVGAVSFAQRFSSSLAIFPHLHLVVPDGVFFEAQDGRVLFRALCKPGVDDLEKVASRIARRVFRWCEQHPIEDEPRDGLAATYAAAVETRRRSSGDPTPPRPSKLVAQVEGFSLEAGRHVGENDREGLLRLLKYGMRPPLAVDRLSRGSDGQLVLRFKKPLRDGSTAVHLSPMELMRRLAAIVPPPGFHCTGYHGLFASHSKLRPKIVPAMAAPEERTTPSAADAPPRDAVSGSGEEADRFSPFPAPEPRERYLDWASLLRRTWNVDVLKCPRCGSRMELIAFVTDPDLCAEILSQLGITRPEKHQHGRH
jgi:hypothetical protein